jgi:hypothetical protein
MLERKQRFAFDSMMLFLLLGLLLTGCIGGALLVDWLGLL